MRQIEEANKFELASSIKALVARALADEMIERECPLLTQADMVIALSNVRFRG